MIYDIQKLAQRMANPLHKALKQTKNYRAIFESGSDTYGVTLTINERVVLLGNNCDIANYWAQNINGSKSDNITLFNVNLLSTMFFKSLKRRFIEN